MDAVKFIEERDRMCNSFGDKCVGCPGFDASVDKQCCSVGLQSKMDATAQIAIVEKWSAAHPQKTRQDIFLEQWPEAGLTKDSVISLCPAVVSAAHRNKTGGCASPKRPQCEVCCREFWTKVVDAQPTSIVDTGVHGYWVHLGGDEWCCSSCGFVITTEGSWDKPTKKYCEDCGAKMDGGSDNG